MSLGQQLHPHLPFLRRYARALTGSQTHGDAYVRATLEAIVHPLVRDEELAFLRAARSAALVVLDIPLLFETGAETRCHAVLVVSAPPEVQRARVLARPGMTAEKFAQVLALQMPDAEKRARADFVIDTGGGLDAARDQVRAVVEKVLNPLWTSPRRRP